MALNFPVTPTVGAVYTAEDQSWIWDGQVWLAQSDGMSVEGSDARYLKLTGGTLTGPLGVSTSVSILPAVAGGNTAVYLRRMNATQAGVFYYDDPSGSTAVRNYTLDGSAMATEVRMSATDVVLNGALTTAIVSNSVMTRLRGDARYLQTTGTVTIDGDLFVADPGANGNSSIVIKRPPGTGSNFIFFAENDNANRWVFQHLSGSSDFQINRCDVAGVTLDTPLRLYGAGGMQINGEVTLTGAVTLNAGPTITGLTPSIEFIETDAGVGLTRWRVRASTSSFIIAAVTDAGALGTGALTFVRNTGGITDVQLAGSLSGVSSGSLITGARGDARYAPKALFDDLVNAVADLRAILAAQVGRINQLEAQVD